MMVVEDKEEMALATGGVASSLSPPISKHICTRLQRMAGAGGIYSNF